MERYFSEMSKIKLLEPDEERTLWYRWKTFHDVDARCRIIESYQPLVFKQAMPYRDMKNLMDIIQEGTVGLIESVESYDPTHGAAFSLYAVHRIRGRMIDYLRREGRDVPWLESDYCDQADRLVDTSAPVSELAETHELVDRLHDALERLPQKERTVLESIYIESQEAKTVASQLKLSVSHIYKLQKQGIRRIRGMLSKFVQKL